MATYTPELIAAAEQRYLRHRLQKNAPFNEKVESYWQSKTISQWIQIGLCTISIVALIAQLDDLGVPMAWIAGIIMLGNSLLFFWLDVLAADSHARRCLSSPTAQYVEALITHPLALKQLLWNWYQVAKKYGQIIPFAVLICITALNKRYDLMSWLLISTAISVITIMVRQRIIRRNIRACAEAYLRRRVVFNPEHHRPVLNENPPAATAGEMS